MSATVVELLARMIQNECVNDGTPDSGHEHRSVETLAGYFGRSGTVVEPHPGRQSVVYRVPGTSAEAPTLMLMGHLDVVPVQASGWSRDPFGGEQVDGFVWGRGAVDMLNQTAAMAAAFKPYLTGEAPPLEGDLVFLGVADEENGGQLGADWILRHHPELVACDYLLTEIASPSFRSEAGPAVPVTVAEKGPGWRTIEAHGVPGHASQPHGTSNALTTAADVITRLAATPTPVHISDEWRAFVAGLPIDAALASRLLDPDAVDSAIEDLAATDPGFARWAHACTHLTLTPTTLRAGQKSNVVPDTAVADIDVRKLPGQDEAAVDDHFRKALGPDLYEELDVEVKFPFPANASPAEGPLWDAIAASIADLTGGFPLPALIPVTTDARFFRARGVVAYGVGLFDDQVSFGDLLSMFHGNDERVSEESVRLTTELLAAVVARFGRAE